MSSFGKRLKRLREEKGKRQEDIAKLLGISRSAISKYENNEREPDINSIYILTNYFNVTTDYLFGKTDIRNTPDYIPENIKLIMGDMDISNFVLNVKKQIGITLDQIDMQNYITGKATPSLGILQVLADYAKVDIQFFYRKNDKNVYKKLKAKNKKDYYRKVKIKTIMKNKNFIRLATKIAENNLNIDAVEKLIDSAIEIKEHQ